MSIVLALRAHSIPRLLARIVVAPTLRLAALIDVDTHFRMDGRRVVRVDQALSEGFSIPHLIPGLDLGYAAREGRFPVVVGVSTYLVATGTREDSPETNRLWGVGGVVRVGWLGGVR